MTSHSAIEYIVAEPLALSLHWENRKIVQLHIHWAQLVKSSQGLSEEAARLHSALAAYVADGNQDWPDLPLDLSQLTDFQRAALNELQGIPSGTTRTYGELAARLGKPGGAQAIGRAMATNPFPLIYPCHRVIGANGKMTGFSTDGGVKMKEFLLRHEGALSGKR